MSCYWLESDTPQFDRSGEAELCQGQIVRALYGSGPTKGGLGYVVKFSIGFTMYHYKS